MDLVLLLKIIFAVTMFLMCLFAGMVPLYVPYFRNNTQIASLGNVFSGGIFLAVAIIHVLPDGNQHIQESLGEFPLAYILCVVGYGLILFIQKVAFHHSHGPSEVRQSLAMVTVQKIMDQDEEGSLIKSIVYNSQRLKRKLVQEGNQTRSVRSFSADDIQTPQLPLLTMGHSLQETVTTAIILAVALSVHSVFEGIAIGLQNSVSGTLNISLAICIHKMPAALALGISMKDMLRKHAIILMVTFTLASPIGIFIGIGLESFGLPILVGIFLSICAGTFLYISCSEVIIEEFAVKKQLYLKFAAFFTGFAVFTILAETITEEG